MLARDRMEWRRDPRPVIAAVVTGIVGGLIAAAVVTVLILTRAGMI